MKKNSLITKKQHDQLGKLFAAEVDGRMFQTRGEPKWIAELLALGFIQRDERKFGPVTCKGYSLTSVGHYAYCCACDEVEA